MHHLRPCCRALLSSMSRSPSCQAQPPPPPPPAPAKTRPKTRCVHPHAPCAPIIHASMHPCIGMHLMSVPFALLPNFNLTRQSVCQITSPLPSPVTQLPLPLFPFPFSLFLLLFVPFFFYKNAPLRNRHPNRLPPPPRPSPLHPHPGAVPRALPPRSADQSAGAEAVPRPADPAKRGG